MFLPHLFDVFGEKVRCFCPKTSNFFREETKRKESLGSGLVGDGEVAREKPTSTT